MAFLFLLLLFVLSIKSAIGRCTRAVQKVRSHVFCLFFLCYTIVNYQGENVQEVYTTTL